MHLEEIIDRDLNSLATIFLKSVDYLINKNDSSFLQVMNFKFWSIKDSPRKISFAKNFKIPPEYEKGFELLFHKIESGTGELFQHQSRKLFKGNAVDLMLYDFGIHHLHLGIKKDLKHKKMIQGTSDVVFTYINKTEIFFIKMSVHGEWHLQKNLKIIHRERPDLIQHRVIKGVMGNVFKDEEILNLRRNGYSYFLEIDKICYMPENYLASKNSVSNLMYFIQLKFKLKKIIEKQILIVQAENNFFDSCKICVKLTELDFYKFEYCSFELIINNEIKSYKVQI